MHSFGISATIWAAIVGTTSALVDAGVRTWVDVDANGYDERTSGNGCSPNGCLPDNTRDGSIDPNSRWSCKGDLLDSSDDDNRCCITYYFEEPQDIVSVGMAFHKGDEKSLILDVFSNGDHVSKFKPGGTSLGYTIFLLGTDETEKLKLCLNDYQSDSSTWLSITEVEILVE